MPYLRSAALRAKIQPMIFRTSHWHLALTLIMALTATSGFFTTTAEPQPTPAVQDQAKDLSLHDPFLWLEEVTSEPALSWVRQQNKTSVAELTSDPGFEPLRKRLLSIFDSRERIPMVSKWGDSYYNFWQDDRHVRGILRRTSLEEYRKPNPAWETVLDIDALAAAENENWVFKGYDPLYPDYQRCLVFLSRGGADATVTREFSLAEKTFVPDGFFLPEAKSDVSWRHQDALYVATDFGPDSLTASGYPRIVKEWQRGTPLQEARTVFEGQSTDVGVSSSVIHDRGHRYEILRRAITFYSGEYHVRKNQAWIPVPIPQDARLGTFQDQFLITLRSDWTPNGTTYPAGALLAAEANAFLDGRHDLAILFQPTSRKSLASVRGTRHFLIVNELDNVRNQLYLVDRSNGQWRRAPLEVPSFGTVSAWGVDPNHSDDYWLTITDFLTPSSLHLGTVGGGLPERLKSLPHFFDTSGLRIDQFHALSQDGTLIPYFQVSRDHLQLNGRNRTLLYGYGGFEISMLSSYSAVTGAAWLEQGGVYVLANIRGGGEFGPAWHQAALKENRQAAYDDFIAVAEDLIERNVTSPRYLGIRGGSNGGLLVGNMLTQRPDLFGAVVCAVPLLDMQRYNKLLAGASWMAEYGDPDQPDEWAFLQRYSPYHNVVPFRAYPRTLFVTSTRDDRVHPAHARKMVARMLQQEHDVLYYENIEGGHGGAADNPQRAFMDALQFIFLQRELGLPPRSP
jgi:prolyl oligopeptidase